MHRMAVSEERALEAMKAHATEHFGHHLTECQVEVRAADDDGLFWWGAIVDERGFPWPGAFHLIGPDGRVWVGSSNPGIDDSELTLQVLRGLHSDGLYAVVDQQPLLNRIEELTRARSDGVRQLYADAKAGQLKDRATRRLP